MTEENVKQYLQHQVDIGKVKFGWNDDITTYNYIEYHISHYHDGNDIIMIRCEYSEGSRTHTKSIEVYIKDIQQFIRDNKLNDLGI